MHASVMLQTIPLAVNEFNTAYTIQGWMLQTEHATIFIATFSRLLHTYSYFYL
jgi:hypothetical protein